MSTTFIIVVAVALFFDFTNGFHDTANSIATLVGTRAMDPQLAVIMAASLNFVGAFISLEVAATIGKGIIDPGIVTLEVVLAGLIGAILWNLTTWLFGIPSSSSHALVGGLVGATLAHTGFNGVLWSGLTQKVLIPSLVAPTLGFLVAALMMALLMRGFKNTHPGKSNTLFRRLQIFSGGWLSLTHGTNDAQKTMGIIALAIMLDKGGSPDFEVPMWAVFSAATAMALGTYAGGWKIIKTLGGKVVKMSPVQGFAASASASGILYWSALSGFPVSTTHCVSGSVMGAGASKRISAVRWTVAADILQAWILTLPCAAVVGAIAYGFASLSPTVLLVIAGAIVLWMRAYSKRPGAAAAH
jgi:PiT family inorganic phosphate transporter